VRDLYTCPASSTFGEDYTKTGSHESHSAHRPTHSGLIDSLRRPNRHHWDPSPVRSLSTLGMPSVLKKRDHSVSIGSQDIAHPACSLRAPRFPLAPESPPCSLCENWIVGSFTSLVPSARRACCEGSLYMPSVFKNLRSNVFPLGLAPGLSPRARDLGPY
jgi:hypothetical protein